MIFKSKINNALRILRYLRVKQNRETRATTLDIIFDLSMSQTTVDMTLSVLNKNALIQGFRGPSGGHKLLLTDNNYSYRSVSISELSQMFYPGEHTEGISENFLEITLASIIR